jgi:hypothetical protein
MNSFDGQTFDPSRDASRLQKQLASVKALMLADGSWRTLGEIEQITGYPQASVSARLRDLRKPRFGSYVVERKSLGGGLNVYRVLPREIPSLMQLMEANA